MGNMNRASGILCVLTAVFLSAALSSCAQEREGLNPGESPAPAPAPAPPSAPPLAELEGTPRSPSPLESSLSGIALDINCDQLLSADAVYRFNPNIGVDPAYVPSQAGQQVLDYAGVSCGWVNQTSADTFSVSVARFSDADLAVIRAQARAKPGAQELTSSEGFFSVVDGVGFAEAFVGDYWAIVESPAFSVRGDVEELLAPLRNSLD
jgi:hypothetical protein